MYSTLNREKVGSKSEVIITNLLAQHGIMYGYEKKLEYKAGKWIESDFTISLPNRDGVY